MARKGLDSLVDALKQSGMNVDDLRSNDDSSDSSRSGSYEATSGNNGRSSTRSRADMPFGSGRPPFSRFIKPQPGESRDGGEPPHFDFNESVGNFTSGWSRRRYITVVIFMLIVIAAAYWWFHPPLSINSVNLWTFVGVVILLPTFLLLRIRSKRFSEGDEQVDQNPTKASCFKALSMVPLIIALVGVGGWVMSLDLFPGNAEKYANVLKTDTLAFQEDIQEVDYSQIPVIDRDSAILLGNREMGSIPDYVSQFEVSNLYSQINYKGNPVRVSPLGYADLFKWFTNREKGIPAYALVNMTTQNAEIVRLGEGNGMKYSTSEPLARNIDRYIQLKYPFYIFDEKSFEVDDEGQPWWICPVRKYTIGLFGGETIEKVILCNASTGDCQELSIEDVPQWVDRVYPAELLVKQYNWSGRYKNGWFNSWLGQSGVVQTTPGNSNSVGYNYLAKDDDVWVYTGVTSATADSSIVGFVLVNQRTAESHYYAVSGATETSAMGSAEGQVQNLRYTSTFPLLINVSNQPTYFMALKDGAGLVKKFAMIDIQRYQNVAVGDTVADTQKAYEQLLATNGAINAYDLKESNTYKQGKGRIRTITQGVIGGNSHYYVVLEGDSAIYDFALPNLVGIVRYREGDEVNFAFVENEPTKPVSEILDGMNGDGGVSSSSASASASASSSSSVNQGSSSSSS